MRVSHRSGTSSKRRGAAVVEAAMVLPFLFGILYGVWEVGRLVHVHQIVSNAAREGGRQAATGTQTALGPTFQVHAAVGNYIQNCGLTIPPDEVVVTVVNETRNLSCTGTLVMDTTNTTNVKVTLSGAAPSSDPVVGSDQFDTIRVDVTYPFKFARWSPSNLYFYMADDTKVFATCKWPCMRDKPVAIDSTIPQSPL